jgi:hypothetical protein
MIKLSSKALGFVEAAIRELPPSEGQARSSGFTEAATNFYDEDHAHRVWSSQEADDYLTRDAAVVVLEVLKNAEKRFQHALDHECLGENEEADAINDIEFVRAIQEDLQRDLGLI